MTRADLPPKKVLVAYVKQAMTLNEPGTKAPVKHDRPPKKPLRTPADLGAALKKNKRLPWHISY